MKHTFGHIFLWIAISGLLLTADNSWAKEPVVAVLLSREIAPYVEMVEGLEAGLAQLPVQRFFLDKQGRPYSLNGTNQLDSQRYSAVVAVGPAALTYLQSRIDTVPLLFGMVLNPSNLFLSTQASPCGISLNLPIAAQLNVIQHRLPTVLRLGVLYDPANNQQWFDRATVVASEKGNLRLIPLPVQSQQLHIGIINDFTGLDAILFIPDRTIISRTVIRYVIEQSFLHRVPVVGYNQFFLDSGAALSFAIDYHQHGLQVAAQVINSINGDSCSGVLAPEFKVKINSAVYSALQLETREVQP